MLHYAVCYDFGKGRVACVMSFENEAHANRILVDGDRKRIGYVGGFSFMEAVTRAGMMERNEPRAWGIIPGSDFVEM